jgi:hypothetical protein
VIAEVLPACDTEPMLRDPPYRRLRVYATDPSFSARLDTAAINEVTLKVRWESSGKDRSGSTLRFTTRILLREKSPIHR